ncbi:hypothetical protein AH03_7 [Erwinia phage AH03]|uniref:Uncharacterized protein n=1 Tax=Erwinia phage AH03 TaxID=2869568 RepID=A0AAE8BPX7_9CAUD|nr:hypothetical protein AH03_7 [Erwinia phage AH03]
MSDLNKLKELAGKATPGPWARASDWERAAVYSTSKDAYPEGKRVVCSGNQNNHGRYNAESWSGSDWNDAAFIAAANPATVIGLIDRLEDAEAELARREEAAGEPVAYSWKGYRGMNLTRTRPESWKQPEDIVPLYAAQQSPGEPLVDLYENLTSSKPVLFAAIIALTKKGFSTKEAKDFIDAFVRDRALTAAQPSALPPQKDSLSEPAGDRWSFAMGYNQAIADAKALGCKAINRPNFRAHHQFDGMGMHGRILLEHRDTLWTAAILEAGFTVQGE